MEYKKYKLGDICKIFGRIGFRGYTTEDLVSSPSNGAISLSPSNIVDGIMDLSKCTYISWEKYEESPEIKIAPNDIVLVKTGNSYGRTAIIRNVEHPMTLNPQFVVLKDIQINPVYLAYFLKTDEFQKQIYGIVGGSAIPTLSQENLANLIIRVPNDNIPNTIADILDSLDGKIELNKQINDNLEAMAKQLYDYWFVQFDFPNEEGKPYKSSGGAMVWNEKLKREIPQGWSTLPISAILDKYPTTKRYETKEYLSQGKYPIIDQGDTYIVGYTNEDDNLLTRHPAVLFGDHSTKVKFLDFDFARGADGTQILYSSNDAVSQYYLYLAVSTLQIPNPGYSRHFKYLKELPIVIPSLSIAIKFANIVKPLFKKWTNNIFNNTALTKQRNELLPLLMNGQASVNYHLSDD